MSLRSKLLALLEVALRVPPLFVIDEILKIGIGLEELTDHDLSNFQRYDKLEDNIHSNSTTNAYDPIFYKFVIIFLLRLLLSALGKLLFIGPEATGLFT